MKNKTSYPKFRSHKQCDACGAFVFSDRYVPFKFSFVYKGEEFGEAEHMERKCMNCGWIVREGLFRDAKNK